MWTNMKLQFKCDGEMITTCICECKLGRMLIKKEEKETHNDSHTYSNTYDDGGGGEQIEWMVEYVVENI